MSVRAETSAPTHSPSRGVRHPSSRSAARPRRPTPFNKPKETAADPGHEFTFNRSGPGIGSHTWHFVMEPTATGTRLTESFDAERPLGSAMSWITEKWVGSDDRDADRHQGMVTTLARVKATEHAQLKVGSDGLAFHARTPD